MISLHAKVNYGGGTLNGSGSIDSTVYNNGVIVVRDDHQPRFNLSADYHQTARATLNLSLNGNKQPSFQVSGDATLSGTLAITTGKGFQPTPGQSYTVLTANKIIGTFSNPVVKLLPPMVLVSPSTTPNPP